MTLHRVFIGYDPRQPLAYNLCQFSIVKRSSEPVTVSPLMIDQLPLTRTGLTTFTFSRFLVPWLCDYQGWALFMDCDVMVLGDIADLFGLADDRYDIMVVKNPRTFEWASVMLFNCARCRVLTPQFVDDPKSTPLQLNSWTDDGRIGSLPTEWNHLVGYDPRRDDAKLAHYTQGTPIWPEVEGCEYELDWFRDYREMNAIEPWANIMGKSVHTAKVGGKLTAKLQVPEVPIVPPAVFDPALSRAAPSARYRELIALYCQMHDEGAQDQGQPPEATFDGRSLAPHIGRIKRLIDTTGAERLLDYGAGKAKYYDGVTITGPGGTVYKGLRELWGVDNIDLYDPGYKPHDTPPEGTYDGVICTDVLEHCPEQDIGWIVDELFGFAGSFLYAAVACHPARKTLPNGENCHVTVKPPEWWAAVFRAAAAQRTGVKWTLALHVAASTARSEPSSDVLFVEG